MMSSVVWLKAGDGPIITINAILGQPIAGFLRLPGFYNYIELILAHPNIVDLVARLKTFYINLFSSGRLSVADEPNNNYTNCYAVKKGQWYAPSI